MKKANSMKKSFAIILLLSLIAGCQQNVKSQSSNQAIDGFAELKIRTIGNTTIESFDTIGYSALEMLQVKHKVKLNYAGSIKCIDKICAESGYWWPMSVNGKKSSLGPKSYIVKNNDRVEFDLSKE